MESASWSKSTDSMTVCRSTPSSLRHRLDPSKPFSLLSFPDLHAVRKPRRRLALLASGPGQGTHGLVTRAGFCLGANVASRARLGLPALSRYRIRYLAKLMKPNAACFTGLIGLLTLRSIHFRRGPCAWP